MNSKYDLALSLLSSGKQREGWQVLFEARQESEILGRALKRFDKPLFKMQNPPAVVYIHAEGGYGDNFALMRYLPLLVEKGYTVKYEASPTVVKLAKDSFPEIEGTIKDFDYHLPIIDLPVVFDTDIDTIPWNGPYLKADPVLVERYGAQKGKIGLCWSSGLKSSAAARAKSIEFNQLKPLIEIDPSHFVALQQGEVRLEAYRTITDCLPRNETLLTWADTAALIENMDLVISIDTSIAHLTGAMGKPVWLMMHKSITSWQFMAECPGASWNTKSPWYPTMKIFRQRVGGDWYQVIKSIAKELSVLNSRS